jgi:hypothetical protein
VSCSVVCRCVHGVNKKVVARLDRIPVVSGILWNYCLYLVSVILRNYCRVLLHIILSVILSNYCMSCIVVFCCMLCFMLYEIFPDCALSPARAGYMSVCPVL